MKAEVKKYKARIGSESYMLVSDEQEAVICKAVLMVEETMQEISQKAQALDEKKIAVLAALQIATKLVNLQQALEYEQRLSSMITHVLDEQPNKADIIL